MEGGLRHSGMQQPGVSSPRASVGRQSVRSTSSRADPSELRMSVSRSVEHSKRLSVNTGNQGDLRASLARGSTVHGDSPRSRASIGFSQWKRQSLVRALTAAGQEPPKNATHKELVALAHARWDSDGATQRSSLPRLQESSSDNSTEQRVRYTSRITGVKYMESPRNGNITEHRSSVPRALDAPAGQLSVDGHRPLGATLPPQSLRSMGSLEDLRNPTPEDYMNSHGWVSEDEETDDTRLAEERRERHQLRMERAMHEEFIKPSVMKAKAYADEHHPRGRSGEKLSWCGTHTGRHFPDAGDCLNGVLCCDKGPHSDLARFGPGIVLYFKWLKLLSWLFLLLGLIVSPQLYFNVVSYSGNLWTPLGLAEASTLGSVAGRDLNVSLISLNFITGQNILKAFVDCDGDCQLDRTGLAWIYTITNLMVATVFVLAVGYVKLFEAKEEIFIQKHSITVEEFTVQFVNPPEGCGENAVKRFFSELTGEHVLEVNLAYNSGNLIRLYVERGKLIHKLWKAASKVYMLREELAKADVEHKKVLDRHAQHNANRISQGSGGAAGQRRSGEDYDVEGAELERAAAVGAAMNQQRRASQAPGRSSIQSVSSTKSRGGRQSYLLSLVALKDAVTKAGENLGLIQSRLEKAVQEYDTLFAEYDNLGETRRSVKAGDKVKSAFITFESQVGYLRCLDFFESGGRDSAGKRIKFQGKAVKIKRAPPPSTILWENFDYSARSRSLRKLVTLLLALLVVSISLALAYVATVTRQVVSDKLVEDDCSGPFGDVVSPEELEEFIEKEARDNALSVGELRNRFLACACSFSTFSQIVNSVFDVTSPCFPYFRDKAPLVGLSFAVTFFVSVSNFGIRLALTTFAKWEKPLSLISMESSLMQRVLVMLVLNTGLVVFLVNFDFTAVGLLGSGILPISGYVDVSAGWFSDVGVQIILIMVFNAFLPHAFLAAELFYVYCIKRNPRCKRPSSQRELNEWYTGPDFRVYYRMAHNLMTCMVTMLYGPGIPLLYPIASFSFLVYYYVDKYLVVSYFKTPPRYDGKLSKKATSLMPFAVVGNLFAAMWMYSAPALFWFDDGGSGSDSFLGNAAKAVAGKGIGEDAKRVLAYLEVRATLPFVLPLALAFLAYTLLLVLAKTFPWFTRLAWRMFDTCLCGLFSRFEINISKVFMHPDLPKARRRGLVRGLESYSLLRNPQYSTAFGIDEKFIREHSRLKSMENLSEDQLPTLPVV